MGRRTLSRRDFLSSSAVLSAAGCASSALDNASGSSCAPSGRSSPLAQSFTVAARIPSDGKHYYIHDPGMARLPSGTLVVAAPCWQVAGFGQVGATGVRLLMARSRDGGRKWSPLATIPDLSDATPFVHNGLLYMFVESQQFGALTIMRSDDEGDSWSAPSTLFEATDALWNCCTSMVEQNGKLYWAVQQGPGFQGNASVIAADTSKDLTDPAAWSRSSPAPRPATPSVLVPNTSLQPSQTGCEVPSGSAPSCASDTWLEPNIVSVGGRIRVFLRTDIDDYATSGLVAVCDLTEDAAGMHLSFAQFSAAPGGQNKCFILRDPSANGLFWMLSNVPADPQAQVLDWKTIEASGRFLPGPGNDRRFLMLSYSLDALSWFPAGCIARAGLMRQSFMYPAAAIDGNDLILISRSSIDGETQHNADQVTFHRVGSFRDLAMNLYPDSLDG